MREGARNVGKKRVCLTLLALLLVVGALLLLTACDDPEGTGQEHGERAREAARDAKEYGKGLCEGLAGAILLAPLSVLFATARRSRRD